MAHPITYLPEPHKRSLSVTAKWVEQTVNELLNLLSKSSSSTLCEKITRNLTNDERKQYESLLIELQNLNKEMFTSLHLEASVMDERQIIGAKLVHLWTVLEDSRSKKMKRYGKLDEDSALEVDNYIQRLLEILEKALHL